MKLIVFIAFFFFGQLSSAQTELSRLFTQFTPMTEQEFDETRGIEIEGYVPSSIGILGTVEFVRDFLISRFENVRVSYEPYIARGEIGKVTLQQHVISYEHHGRSYKYSIVPDFSVRPDAGFYPVEVVSPILHSNEDFENHMALIEHLTEMGFRSHPHLAGVHAHIGVPNLTPAELALIGYVFSMIEDDISAWANISERRREYTQPFLDVEQRALRSGQLANMPLSEIFERYFSEAYSRYRIFNLAAVFKTKTIELRFLNGTTNEEIIGGFSDLAASIIRAVRTAEPRLVKLISDGPFTLNDVLKSVDLDPDHYNELAELIRKESETEGSQTLSPKIFRAFRSTLAFLGYYVDSKSIGIRQNLKKITCTLALSAQID